MNQILLNFSDKFYVHIQETIPTVSEYAYDFSIYDNQFMLLDGGIVDSTSDNINDIINYVKNFFDKELNYKEVCESIDINDLYYDYLIIPVLRIGGEEQ